MGRQGDALDLRPPLPPTGDALLTHYFQHRRADWPAQATPDLLSFSTLILAQSSSAPGVDGEPYEVYHHGVNFVAHLLGQDLHAAADTDAALANTLGPAQDLLVWIPKPPNVEVANEWRPLQIPT